MKIYKPTGKDSVARLVVRLTLDPWIAMLAAGGLGHRLHQPWLFRIGFFEALLIIIVITCLTPGFPTEWKEEKK